MTNTINNLIPFVPENTIDPAAGLNLSLNTVDALLQLAVLTIGNNAPPGSPAEGDRHIVGTAPTGAWTAKAGKLARYLDAGWHFYDAKVAINLEDKTAYFNNAGTWEKSLSGETLLQDAIIVNSFNADSVDLAPYLDEDDGKWHMPDNALIIVNTEFQSAASIVERVIYAEGNLYFMAMAGARRSILLWPGDGDNDCAVEQENDSDVFFMNVIPASTDSSRDFIKGTDGTSLIIYCPSCYIPNANLGLLNFDRISIRCDAWQLQSVMPVVGESCFSFSLDGIWFNPPFGAEVGFDLTSAPLLDRVITVHNCTGYIQEEYIINIDSDNYSIPTTGYFRGNSGLYADDAGLITAVSDSEFNANPALSMNFEFSSNSGATNTKRLGECYFAGDTEITISSADTWTDLYEAAIAQGELANGLAMTANAGEIEYLLPTPGLVCVCAKIEGQPASGSPAINFGAFLKPADGAYAQVTKAGFPIEMDMEHSGGSMYSAFIQYTIMLRQGDKIKMMILNDDNTNNFDLHNYSIIAQVNS